MPIATRSPFGSALRVTSMSKSIADMMPPPNSSSISESSLRRSRGRKCNGLDLRRIELARGMVDVEANNLAFFIEVDIETERDLPRLDARNVFQLDVEAVGVRVIMQLHR